jgi:hypothetical protein
LPYKQNPVAAMSKQRPWNVEIYRGFDSNFKEEHLLVNVPIREFLDREDLFFLLGAKGLGKTLFLRYKSYLYHNNYGESFRFNASNSELTENLNIHPDTFSKEDLLRFRDDALWRLIWELTLWTVIFRLIKEPLPDGLERLVGNSQQISNVLTRLLNHRKKVAAFRDFVTEFQEQKNKVQNGVALFIDDVDQTLQSLLSFPHPTDNSYDGKQSPAVEIWVNAQMGLVGAIYNLARQNGHIKIYAAIRREAFEAYESPVKINYEQHISRLEYTREEIEEIFHKNIQMTETANLFPGKGHSWAARFVGFESIPHRFATKPDGEKISESIFNFIYRHTYGRPRDIVLMGKKIADSVSTLYYKNALEEDRYRVLRTEVNRVSNELFNYYKQEVIPYWDDVIMQNFVATVRSNVIPREDFHLFDEEVLKLYYNLGLLGHVKEKDHSGKHIQVFHPTATYNYRKFQALPQTDFLLIHSTLDATLLDRHTFGNFYNPYNIIGPGNDFFPRIDRPVRQVEEYYPLEISGNRFKSASQGSGHDFPLENIYRNFFNFENAQSRFERFQNTWKLAEQVLGILGRICYCHRLENQFQSKFYAAKQAESFMELAQYNYVRPYNAEIPDDFSEKAFDRFQDKLFGRYITLGCYLVLDLRIEWIHALLTQERFEFQYPCGNKDTAFYYLSRGFFIRELKREEPRDPRSPESRHSKQRIFNNLSAFEQKSLKDFIRNATDEVQFLDWVEKDEHSRWLQDQVLQLIWKPE